MNEIGWLPAKHSPFGTPIAAKSASNAGREESNFAAFLANSDNGEQQSELNTSPRAPAAIPINKSASNSVLGEASPGGDLKTSSNIMDERASYSTASQLRDSAIAFDARPIVGPASFAHTPDTVFGQMGFIDRGEIAAVQAYFAASIDGDESQYFLNLHRSESVSRAVSALISQAATLPANAMAPSQGIQSNRLDPPSMPQAERSLTNAGLQPEASGRQSNRSASTAAVFPLHMLAAQSPAFAQLLASPSEYRLVIRGQRLSEDQRNEVLRAVRGGLAEFGMPTRPIAVFERDGLS
ncbi:MAG: hypothetical protein AAGI28_06150 [Pseudomonadota bacterium]